MKKIFTVILAVIILAALALPSSAFTWTDKSPDNAFDTAPDYYDGATVIALSDGWTDGATNARHGTDSNGGNEFDYVYLKADGKGDYSVTFNVTEAGVYDFGFTIMGWTASVLRVTDVMIDGGERVRIAYDYLADNQFHNHYWSGLSGALTAGEHTVTLSLSEDFDDSTVKSLYFTEFFYELAAEQPATETDPPATEAPTTEAPATNPPAPSTADLSTVPVALLICAAAASVAIALKKKAVR